MKTKIFLSCLFFLLISSTNPVLAQNSTPSGSKLRDQINKVRLDAKQAKQEVKEEKKLAISQLKLEKIKGIYNIIKSKLTKRHDTLITIKTKLETRIANNPMKKDTTTAVAKLKEFDAAETLYIQDLAALDAKFTQITSSTTPTKFPQLLKELKTSETVVKKDLDNIKKIIRDAIVLLAKSPKLEVTKIN